MTKKRIQVYAEPETKRRIELAAARHRMPVTKHCLNAIQQQLADDVLLEDEQIVASPPTGDEDDLNAVHHELSWVQWIGHYGVERP